MYFNNTVYSQQGGILGFRCYECNQIKSQMWGDVCNECRDKERRHKELIAAIAKLEQKDGN